jgi:basic membrane protein A and related proteins
MIRVGDFGPKVPKGFRMKFWPSKKQWAQANCCRFTGPITDNEGKLVLPAGQSLSDAQILNMNYLVQGVQGRVSR